jgi:hypothetical protein
MENTIRELEKCRHNIEHSLFVVVHMGTIYLYMPRVLDREDAS